jgi:hypothetical protein
LNPGAIDEVTVEADGSLAVHLVQTWEWDGSDHLLLLLQEKLYNYLAFIADGELARRYPQAKRGFRVVVDMIGEPDQRTAELLRRAGEEFRQLGGTVLTRRRSADR